MGSTLHLRGCHRVIVELGGVTLVAMVKNRQKLNFYDPGDTKEEKTLCGMALHGFAEGLVGHTSWRKTIRFFRVYRAPISYLLYISVRCD